MTAAAAFIFCIQVGGGGGGGAAPSPALQCLTLLVGLTFLSILSYRALKVRKGLKGSGKDKPDFTSLRSTGKTIVNAPPDDDDPNKWGSVN